MVIINKSYDQKFKELNKRLEVIEDLIIRGNIRLESLISTAIEREMITQDQYDKIYNMLVEFGRRKGWVK